MELSNELISPTINSGSSDHSLCYARDTQVSLPHIYLNPAWTHWFQHTLPSPSPPSPLTASSAESQLKLLAQPQATTAPSQLLPDAQQAAAFEMQMQHLRFPTPPITPPRAIGGLTAPQAPTVAATIIKTRTPVAPADTGTDITAARLSHVRTQSVIMKVGPASQSPVQQRVHSPQLAELHGSSSLTASAAALDTISSSESCSTNNDYNCDWSNCGRYFESLESLAAHVTQIHAVASLTDGLYYCRWAGCPRSDRGFNARYKMLVHVRTHTKEKPHQCHLCEKSFSRAENLKIHIRSHSGEKPYVCTYEGCHKAYSNSSDRFKHTRTHSMEKPYMCKVPGCQKRYTDPSSLRKHVKTFKHGVQLLSGENDSAKMPASQNNGTLTASPSLYTRTEQQPQQLPALPPTLHYMAHGEPVHHHGRHHHASSYLCLPAAQQVSYYLGIGPEELHHIKATSELELECYYAATNNAAGYWYEPNAITPNTRATADSLLHPLHKTQFTMELDETDDADMTPSVRETDTSIDVGMPMSVNMETPLDLRVRRS